MKPLVSIIIPTFNRSQLISTTLNSIKNQTYPFWECLVVDDGSTDDTLKVLEAYSQNDNRIKYFRRPIDKPKGANACRNYGLDMAKGDYLVFFDSDDLMAPDCLKDRVIAISRYPEFDFYVFQAQLFNTIPEDLDRIHNVLNKPMDDLSRFISFDYPWHISTVVLKKKVFEEDTLRWDEALACHQDLDFNINLLTKSLTYKKFPGHCDVFIRMEGSDKVSHLPLSMYVLNSKLRFLCNIITHLKSLNDGLAEDLLKRVYNLAVSYGVLFINQKQSHLIKKAAKCLKVSYIKLMADSYYWGIVQNNPNFWQKGFLSLYNIGNVTKRLDYLPFHTTLAQLSLKQDLPLHLKVVHVSTSQSGGAGIAAFRLHEGLKALHVPSSFLTLKKTSFGDESVVTFKNKKRSLFQKVIHKFFKTSQSEKQRKALSGLKGGYEIFSFPTTDYKIHEHPLIKEASLIHLHWVAGFVDIPSFFKHVKQPIVWTIHDMNPFQGGFHYKDDVKNYKNYITDLDDRILEQKRISYSKSSLKHIVSPSEWLMKASQQSELMKPFTHQVIRNGVDPNVFTILDKKASRATFQLPQETTILAFMSEVISNTRKGFDILREAVSQMRHRKAVTLVAVGQPPKQPLEDVVYTGTINDEHLLTKLYNATDAFVIPSREDNLPNVMVEALICGTPVLATPVGGMLEIIQHGTNGYLAEDLSSSSLSKILDTFVETKNRFDSKTIRAKALGLFDIKQQANCYLQLYMNTIDINGYA